MQLSRSGAKLSLFLSRLKPGTLHRRRGHKTSAPSAKKTPSRSGSCSSSSFNHPCRKNSSKSVPLVTLKENVADGRSCSSCGKCSSCSCKQQQQKQHLSVTVPSLPLLRSPTVVRQVSYHWRTVQRLTLKSQRSRDFGTQASFDESDIASLQSDAVDRASLDASEKASLVDADQRRQASASAFGALTSRLRSSFRARSASLSTKPSPTPTSIHLTTSKTFSFSTMTSGATPKVSPSASASSSLKLGHRPGIEAIKFLSIRMFQEKTNISS